MKELRTGLNIDIFYKVGHESWAREQFDKICDLIPFECIKEKKLGLNRCVCILNNGKHIQTNAATSCNCAGRRCDIAIVEEELGVEEVNLIMCCLMSSNNGGTLMLRGGI